jgi:5-methylthioadenosine/S-adenosylhomocysteine deaminase
MCKMCDEGVPHDHSGSPRASRRDFLKASAATGAAAAGLSLFGARPEAAQHDSAPEDSGRRGRRYVIRGGHVMSMDPAVGDFPRGDVLWRARRSSRSVRICAPPAPE